MMGIAGLTGAQQQYGAVIVASGCALEQRKSRRFAD
jgi:hypothetical protein